MVQNKKRSHSSMISGITTTAPQSQSQSHPLLLMKSGRDIYYKYATNTHDEDITFFVPLRRRQNHYNKAIIPSSFQQSSQQQVAWLHQQQQQHHERFPQKNISIVLWYIIDEGIFPIMVYPRTTWRHNTYQNALEYIYIHTQGCREIRWSTMQFQRGRERERKRGGRKETCDYHNNT